MNSLSLITGIDEVNLLLKKFNRPRWLFLCKEYIFPEVIMNMKSQGYKYNWGKKEKELFVMSFSNNDSKIDFILGLRNFTSILEKYNEIFVNKIIPRSDILHCIEKNSRLVALSKTNYIEASLTEGNVINHLLNNFSSKVQKLDYYDIDKDKMYEMKNMKMLCGSYLYI
jgi:hypothetical protein